VRTRIAADNGIGRDHRANTARAPRLCGARTYDELPNRRGGERAHPVIVETAFALLDIVKALCIGANAVCTGGPISGARRLRPKRRFERGARSFCATETYATMQQVARVDQAIGAAMVRRA